MKLFKKTFKIFGFTITISSYPKKKVRTKKTEAINNG
jgi:hypothetical protein